jgi:hypothetical protein
VISIQRLVALPPVTNSSPSLPRIPLSLCILYTLCFRKFITQPLCTTTTWPMRCRQIPTGEMMVLITNGERQWKRQQGSQAARLGTATQHWMYWNQDHWEQRSVPTTIAMRFHHSHAYTCHNGCSHDLNPGRWTAPIHR